MIITKPKAVQNDIISKCGDNIKETKYTNDVLTNNENNPKLNIDIIIVTNNIGRTNINKIVISNAPKNPYTGGSTRKLPLVKPEKAITINVFNMTFFIIGQYNFLNVYIFFLLLVIYIK